MIRIEADAIQSSQHEIMSAPVRLITNQSKIRIILKRRVMLKLLKSVCLFYLNKIMLILFMSILIAVDKMLYGNIMY